jgi:hypothetical protein
MEDKYHYMMFRQDLPGFGEPAEGSWEAGSGLTPKPGKAALLGFLGREMMKMQERSG